jgi:hypothetical protein
MEELKFNVLLAALSIGVFLIEIILWAIITGIFNGFIKKPNGNIKGWPFLLLIPIFFCLTPATVYFYRTFKFKIPEKPVEINTFIKADNEELNLLSQQMYVVTKALHNPKDLTLKQIESILANSLDYSKRVNTILSRNDSIIGQLKTEVEIERKNADASRKVAETIKSITKEQLEAVKLVITSDAKEASRRSFLIGVLSSFPVGFLTSLLASFVYKKWGASAKKTIESKLDHKSVK